LFPENGS